MQKILHVACIGLLCASPVLAAKPADKAKEKAPVATATTAALTGFDAQVSYAMGIETGKQIAAAKKESKKAIDIKAYLAAFKLGQTSNEKFLQSYMLGARQAAQMIQKGADIDQDAYAQGFALGLNKDQDAAQVKMMGLTGGAEMGQLQTVGMVQFDYAAYERALVTAAEGDSTKYELSDSATKAALTSLQTKVQEYQQLKAKEYQAKVDSIRTNNIEKAAEFFITNKMNKDVTVTASGLQYKTIQPGTGELIRIGDSLQVHYTGRLLDGTVFDSSTDRGPMPIVLQNGGLIPGWIEMLQLMRPGQKVRVWIPERLAYGDAGSPPVIGPKAALDFDIEVIEVKAAKEGTPATPAGTKPKVKAKPVK